MTFLWSYGLIVLAAVFNAFMDTVADEPHFNKSIFKNWKKSFWSKEISWENKNKVLFIIFKIKVKAPAIFSDGWHIAKAAMITCIGLAVALFVSHHQWWVHFISLIAIWKIVFELFYSKIFKA